MTDRELLELAAKAAGLNIKSYAVDTDDKFIHLIVGPKFTKEKIAWNPLADDGAALRLAVKLGLLVHGSDSPSTVWCQVGECPDAFLEAAKPDPYAATRRAITRAAAEIGRSDK